jgi:hypothetical protein
MGWNISRGGISAILQKSVRQNNGNEVLGQLASTLLRTSQTAVM